MSNREAIFQKLNPFLIGIYSIVSLGLAVYNIQLGRPYYYMLAFGGLLLLAVPFLLEKLFHLQIVHQFRFVVYLFSFLAYVIGLVVPAYSLVPYYDKAIHTLSGVFCTFGALLLFYLLSPQKEIREKDFPLVSVFSLSVSMAVAGLWELSEYAVSVVFGMDPQNVLTTGVHDTMQDMLVCLIGSLLFLISIYCYYKKRKTSLLMGIFQTFHAYNFPKKR